MDGLNQGSSMFKDVLPVNFKSIFALICKRKYPFCLPRR
jgi:hypothetical protein